MRNWNNWNGQKKCGQLSIGWENVSPRLGRLFAKKAIDEKGQQVRKKAPTDLQLLIASDSSGRDISKMATIFCWPPRHR